MDAKRKLISYFYDGSLIVTCTGEKRFGSFPACVELMNRFTTVEALIGQIVADFIVEYRINDEHDLEVGYATCTPWKL